MATKCSIGQDTQLSSIGRASWRASRASEHGSREVHSSRMAATVVDVGDNVIDPSSGSVVEHCGNGRRMATCRCAPSPRDPAAAAPAAEAAARRWAGLAGVVAGLAGLGLAGLAAWLVAPAGAPVTAVGELIIALLPAPLVNFGKEALGFADKPILLAMIVLAVLRSGRSRRSARVRPPVRRGGGVRDHRRRSA